jgi:NAD(P)H-dependent FMN reductase
VLFITPEYNASISGVLKNAIDWVGGPWAENQVAIVGYGWSASNSGRKHLTDIMTRLKSNVLEPQTGLSFMKEISVDGTAQDENAAEMVKNTLNAVFKPINA